MTMQNQCPECDKELDWDSGAYQCNDCNKTYTKVAFCPDCDAELERLRACGALAYFCNTCNEQKSKSRVRVEFQHQG